MSLGKFKRARENEMLETLQTQSERIAELEKERDECHAMVVYMGAIMDESEGVAGYHLNGDIAKWDDLFTVPLYENALQAHNLEQQAKGLEDYVRKTMDNSYILHLDPEDIHHCILINLNATALRLLERAKALKEKGE